MPRVGIRLRLALGGRLPLSATPQPGTERLPFPDLQLEHWTTEAGLEYGGSGGVASWEGQIAGVTVEQTTEADQPPIQESAYLKGANVIKFDSAGQELRAVNSGDFPDLDGKEFTVVTACRVTSSALVDILHVAAGTGNPSVIGRTASDQRVYSFANDGTSNQSESSADRVAAPDGYQTFGFGVGPSSLGVYSRLGGVEIAPSSVTLTGLDSISVGTSFGFDRQAVEIAEIVIYDGLLTAEQWIEVQEYYDRKYRPEEVPLQLGFRHWWDPTDTDRVTLNAGNVSDWEDSIGGVTMSQSTANRRPGLVTSTRTGHTMLAFDRDSSNRLESNDVGLLSLQNSDFTAYVEHVKLGGGSNAALAGWGSTVASGDNVWMYYSTSDKLTNMRRSGGTTTRALCPDLARVGAASWGRMEWDGSNIGVQAFRNVGNTASSSVVTASVDVFSLGTVVNLSPGSHFDGEIGHVLIHDRELETYEHEAVQAWLESQWESVAVPFRTGAAYWWDPTDTDKITLNGSNVSAWEDRIGGVTMSQSTGANQPELVTSTRTGHTMLSFDGSNDVLYSDDAGLAGTFDGGNAFTAFVEHATGVPTTAGAAFSAGDTTTAQAGASMEINTASKAVRYADAVTVDFDQASEAIRTEAAAWGYMRNDGSTQSAEFYRGGMASGGVTASPTMDRVALAGRVSGASFTRLFAGQIGHVLVHPYALTDDDHTEIQNWLESQWESVSAPMRNGVSNWWDPDDTANITLDLDQEVAAWVDKVEGVTMAQTDGTKQPVYGMSARTGHNMLTFDGSNEVLYSDDAGLAGKFDGGNSYTMFAEHVLNGVPPSSAFLSAGDTTTAKAGASLEITSTAQVARYADGSSVEYRQAPATPRVSAAGWGYARNDASNQSVGYYRGADGSWVTSASPTFDRTAIGARVQGSGFPVPANAEIGNVMVFPYALTDVDAAEVGEYLEALWEDVEAPLVLGAAEWANPAEQVTLEDGGVAAWGGSIGGTEWSEGTPANRPGFLATGSSPSGAPAIVFTQSESTRLVSTDASVRDRFSGSQQFTEYAVWRKLPGTQQQVLTCADAGANDFRRAHVDSGGPSYLVQERVAGTIVSMNDTTGYPSDGENLWSEQHFSAVGASGFGGEILGGTAGSATGSSAASMERHVIGARATSASVFTAHLSAEVYGLVQFDRSLGSEDHADMQAWAEGLLGI